MVEQSIKAKNDLLLAEINQYHAIVKDFSHQSTSIKKLSITIYISFLTLYYGVEKINMPLIIFFIIGISISFFSYIYEIYIDFIRQKMRIRMQDKIVDYENNNGITSKNKKGILIIKVLFFKFFKVEKKFFRYRASLSEKEIKQEFFVDVFHSMYFIYLIEIIVTIFAGVFKTG